MPQENFWSSVITEKEIKKKKEKGKKKNGPFNSNLLNSRGTYFICVDQSANVLFETRVLIFFSYLDCQLS